MTTETNAERLEKVKRIQDAYYSQWNLQDEPKRLGLLVLGHLDWLIAQAERAQELEERIERYKSEKYKAFKKNARLRKALEEIVNFDDKYGSYPSWEDCRSIARQALEGIKGESEEGSS